MGMNPLSIDLANGLLKRHATLCLSMPDRPEAVMDTDIRSATISYKDLLKSIGAPETLAVGIGKYLFEVASWSTAQGLPPINALAVNGQFQMPGPGYFAAPGGDDWEREIRECIACKKYPSKVL